MKNANDPAFSSMAKQLTPGPSPVRWYVVAHAALALLAFTVAVTHRFASVTVAALVATVAGFGYAAAVSLQWRRGRFEYGVTHKPMIAGALALAAVFVTAAAWLPHGPMFRTTPTASALTALDLDRARLRDADRYATAWADGAGKTLTEAYLAALGGTAIFGDPRVTVEFSDGIRFTVSVRDNRFCVAPKVSAPVRITDGPCVFGPAH